MSIKKLHWSGDRYSFSIRRHWNHFFDLTTFCKIRVLQMEKALPAGAGYHIIEIKSLCESMRDCFQSHGDWWLFSKMLCDQYADYYVMGSSLKSNIFFNNSNERLDHNSVIQMNSPHPLYGDNTIYIDVKKAIENLAKTSRGYLDTPRA